MKTFCKDISRLVLRASCFAFALGTLAVTAQAATFYKGTITITSVPPANAVLSAPGDARGWQTAASITNAQRQIATTNTLQAAATNLFQHLSLYGFTNVNGVKLGTNNTALPTNTVVLEMAVDQFVTLTTLSNWATITYSTNSGAAMVAVRVPHTSEAGLVQTQIVTGLINALADSRATNKITNTSPAFSEFITTRTNVQSVTNLNTRGGTNFNGYLSGASGQLSNVGVVNLVATNFSAPGAGASSLAIGNGASAIGASAISIGDNAAATNANSIAIGVDTIAEGEFSTAVGSAASATAFGATAFGDSAVASAVGAAAFGASAGAAHSNAVAVGALAQTTQTNQIRLGTAAETVSIPGSFDLLGTGTVARLVVTNLDVQAGTLTNVGIAASGLTATQAIIVTLNATNGTLTNLKLHTVENTQHFTNSGAVLHRERTVSSLAAGNNIIDRGTNNFVFFSATAGAATVNAITNGFGDGDWIDAVNGTGYALTVANQSGFSTIPQNRILTVNGASNVTVFPGGLMRFRYSANDARWLLVYPEVFSAVATNAIASVNGAGSNTFLIAPVFATSATSTNTTNAWVWTASGTNGAGAWAPAPSGATNFVLALNGAGTNLAATYFTGATNDPFQVQSSNGTPVLVVKTNGRVGIGTVTPEALVTISNAPGNTGTPLFHAGTNNTANGLWVTTNGNVGVGTAAPSYTMHVAGNGFFSSDLTLGAGRYFYPRESSTLERIGSPNSGSLEMGNGASTFLGVTVGAGSGLPLATMHISNAPVALDPLRVYTRAGNGALPALTVTTNRVTLIGATAATNTPTAGHAGLFAATNSGTVALMAIDSAGGLRDLSPSAFASASLTTNGYITLGWVDGWNITTTGGSTAIVSNNSTVWLTNAGAYEVSFGTGIIGGNSDSVAVSFYTNGVEFPLRMSAVMSSPAVQETGFKTAIVSLPGNSNVRMWATNFSSATLGLSNACLVVKRL
jgi:hypothetical protein